MKRFVILLGIGLLLAGCEPSAPQNAVTPAPASTAPEVVAAKPVKPPVAEPVTASKTPIEQKDCNTPVMLYVDASTAATVVIPDEIKVCTRRQNVIWYAHGATEFTITFDARKVPGGEPVVDPKDASCGPAYDASNKQVGIICELSHLKHKKGGKIGYGYHILAADGKPVDKDPQLIIYP
jgi:hypothetical protein